MAAEKPVPAARGPKVDAKLRPVVRGRQGQVSTFIAPPVTSPLVAMTDVHYGAGPVQRRVGASPTSKALETAHYARSPMQRRAAAGAQPRADVSDGLPWSLRTGLEALSGLSLDHVRVHYNSSRPARFSALAYAQGNNIHLAPGQERHLPHEAWHVVQQRQGRVYGTLHEGGVALNDDAALEREADVMGARAEHPWRQPRMPMEGMAPPRAATVGGTEVLQRVLGPDIRGRLARRLSDFSLHSVELDPKGGYLLTNLVNRGILRGISADDADFVWEAGLEIVEDPDPSPAWPADPSPAWPALLAAGPGARSVLSASSSSSMALSSSPNASSQRARSSRVRSSRTASSSRDAASSDLALSSPGNAPDLVASSADMTLPLPMTSPCPVDPFWSMSMPLVTTQAPPVNPMLSMLTLPASPPPLRQASSLMATASQPAPWPVTPREPCNLGPFMELPSDVQFGDMLVSPILPTPPVLVDPPLSTASSSHGTPTWPSAFRSHPTPTPPSVPSSSPDASSPSVPDAAAQAGTGAAGFSTEKEGRRVFTIGPMGGHDGFDKLMRNHRGRKDLTYPDLVSVLYEALNRVGNGAAADRAIAEGASLPMRYGAIPLNHALDSDLQLLAHHILIYQYFSSGPWLVTAARLRENHWRQLELDRMRAWMQLPHAEGLKMLLPQQRWRLRDFYPATLDIGYDPGEAGPLSYGDNKAIFVLYKKMLLAAYRRGKEVGNTESERRRRTDAFFAMVGGQSRSDAHGREEAYVRNRFCLKRSDSGSSLDEASDSDTDEAFDRIESDAPRVAGRRRRTYVEDFDLADHDSLRVADRKRRTYVNALGVLVKLINRKIMDGLLDLQQANAEPDNAEVTARLGTIGDRLQKHRGLLDMLQLRYEQMSLACGEQFNDAAQEIDYVKAKFKIVDIIPSSPEQAQMRENYLQELSDYLDQGDREGKRPLEKKGKQKIKREFARVAAAKAKTKTKAEARAKAKTKTKAEARAKAGAATDATASVATARRAAPKKRASLKKRWGEFFKATTTDAASGGPGMASTSAAPKKRAAPKTSASSSSSVAATSSSAAGAITAAVIPDPQEVMPAIVVDDHPRLAAASAAHAKKRPATTSAAPLLERQRSKVPRPQ